MSDTDQTSTAAPTGRGGGSDVPPVVTLHLWGVKPGHVPAAVMRMGLLRGPLRRTPELRFAKLLGTGHGRSFDVRDADPLHWGVLAAWQTTAAAEAFDLGPVVASWRRLAVEELAFQLVPLTSTGRWAGQQPFGSPTPHRATGRVAALTRARLVPSRAATFWRAVPPVAADLQQSPGLELALGIGEAPVGLQGTFSLWQDEASLRGFVSQRSPHREVIARTHQEGWYAEELFARFAVRDVRGSFGTFLA
ncbi:MAG: monooxygenase [Actinomycetes bacterium]